MGWEFEILKVCVQGGVGVLVAWFTVRIALSRYKRERTWDRQLTVFADAISALNDMQTVTNLWIENIENGHQFSDEYMRLQGERYMAAKRRLSESFGIASVMLSNDVGEMLRKVYIDIERINCPDAYHAHRMEYDIVQPVLDQMIVKARVSLK
ncbi:hypothetical protein FHS96_003081 [Sphingomonas zeicaulis]|uniref:hypothetical protein n=1 Tax=Sphingomonas zeicaulis TaxID=1632740 RepID=UPI003D1D4594